MAKVFHKRSKWRLPQAVLFLSLLAVFRVGAWEPAPETPSLRFTPVARLGSPLIIPEASLAQHSTQVSFGTNFINLSSRETSRQFFNLVYNASEGATMAWTGDYATGNPGTTSPAYAQAVLRRVNFFRTMGGVPADIVFLPEYNAKCQSAALMMSVNHTLSHTPPNTWLFYTAAGADAAGHSNLTLGYAGPRAVVSQMSDQGDNNAPIGHRRWLLYPQSRVMGTGDVPGQGNLSGQGANYSMANAVWVYDQTNYFNARPPTRNAFVSWPPPGFVPYPVVYPRWSFSYPGASFTGSTVSMTSNGVPLTVTLETVTGGIGDNTLVWVPEGQDALAPDALDAYTRPATDTVYQVTLNNVTINATPRSFTYQVTVFDPEVPGPDYQPPIITGTNRASAGVPTPFQFSSSSNAVAYEWLSTLLVPRLLVDGAEGGLTNFLVTASTNDYAVVDSAVRFAGSSSFHLTHTNPVSQILQWKPTMFLETNSQLRFRSRLGFSAEAQTAKVELSSDGGLSWVAIYSQQGSQELVENNFTLRTVALGAYAGRSVLLRFNYDILLNAGLPYYPQTESYVGWHLDDLVLTNAQEALTPVLADASANRTFTLTAPSPGNYVLSVRPILFGDYASDWGPVLRVTVVQPTLLEMATPRKVGGSQLQLDFLIRSGTNTNFKLWSAPLAPGPYTREDAIPVQTLVSGSQYRAVVPLTNTNRFYRVLGD